MLDALLDNPEHLARHGVARLPRAVGHARPLQCPGRTRGVAREAGCPPWFRAIVSFLTREARQGVRRTEAQADSGRTSAIESPTMWQTQRSERPGRSSSQRRITCLSPSLVAEKRLSILMLYSSSTAPR